MARKTERDQAPPGYITPQAAAELLGVTDATIRNHIKAGKLAGTTVEIGAEEDEYRETRYYALRDAVAEMVEARDSQDGAGEIARRLVGLEVEEHSREYAEMILKSLEETRDEQRKIREGQEKMMLLVPELASELKSTREGTQRIVAQMDEREGQLGKAANTLSSVLTYIKLVSVILIGLTFLVLVLVILRLLGLEANVF